VIAQSLAIIEYLRRGAPGPPFLPADPLGRATVRSIAQAIACDIHPLNNLRVLNYLRDPSRRTMPAVTAIGIATGSASASPGSSNSRGATRARAAYFYGEAPRSRTSCCAAGLQCEAFRVRLAPYSDAGGLSSALEALPDLPLARPEHSPTPA